MIRRCIHLQPARLELERFAIASVVFEPHVQAEDMPSTWELCPMCTGTVHMTLFALSKPEISREGPTAGRTAIEGLLRALQYVPDALDRANRGGDRELERALLADLRAILLPLAGVAAPSLFERAMLEQRAAAAASCTHSSGKAKVCAEPNTAGLLELGLKCPDCGAWLQRHCNACGKTTETLSERNHCPECEK